MTRWWPLLFLTNDAGMQVLVFPEGFAWLQQLSPDVCRALLGQQDGEGRGQALCWRLSCCWLSPAAPSPWMGMQSCVRGAVAVLELAPGELSLPMELSRMVPGRR